MKTNRLLYLSTQQMVAYRWHSGEMVCEGLFAATEDGHQDFAAYLKQNPKSFFSILANVSEEGFHIETIPFLQGADRRAIIGRKLGQLFFNAELTTSLSLGYEKTKRKDERIMLAALTNNDFFAPWLKAIAHTGTALSGIYTLPFLAPTLLRRLKLPKEKCLLLTVQDQTIRQSYLENGELHFSRLSPLQNSSIGGIAQAFSAEALKLQQYLTSQRLIGRNQPIQVHILAHTGAKKAIQNSCVNTATIQYNIIDIESCVKATGLKAPPPDSHCEQLLLNLLITAPPRIQFANDDLLHNYHIGKIRSMFHGLGTIALLGCLLFSAQLLFDAYTIAQESESLHNEAGLARQRYNSIVSTFPPIPTNNDTLRRIIDRYVELEKKSSSPETLYYEISRALQLAPEIELDSIDWEVGSREASANPSTGQTSTGNSMPRDSETVIVRGTLKFGSSANARQILEAFNRLVEALRSNPKLQVNALQQPFDIESGKSLKGGDTTVEDAKPRTFSLQVTRKVES
ncbi:MAG: hypothetical protein IPP84_04260 [Propionivibrio sp.]|uniref:hypothetical protein n=1 Tax=Propionivibrio sp. TaxID=2212460 RepID=UPI0025D72755|nr:hypothetical protein [Propionivibrio sp.]MBL0207204.1 hypothetical protein [Propionivibrio sp.]